jgi:hypothetical protein
MPWWVAIMVGLIGVGGTGLGAYLNQTLTARNQREQRIELRQQQWDKDIIQALTQLTTKTLKLPSLSNRYWALKERDQLRDNLSPEDKVQMKERRAELWVVLYEIERLAVELGVLTASDDVRKAALQFYEDCCFRFNEDMNVVGEGVDKDYEPMGFRAEHIDIDARRDQLAKLIQEHLGIVQVSEYRKASGGKPKRQLE